MPPVRIADSSWSVPTPNRAIPPNETGSPAMSSVKPTATNCRMSTTANVCHCSGPALDRPDSVHVIFESLWEDWDDLVQHREGDLDEYKYVTRWVPYSITGPVTTHIYGQAGI